MALNDEPRGDTGAMDESPVPRSASNRPSDAAAAATDAARTDLDGSDSSAKGGADSSAPPDGDGGVHAGGAGGRAPAPPPGQDEAVPPLWLSIMFLAGLVVLYAGQRLILKWEWEGIASVATWGGVALMVAGTLGRLSPMFRGRGAYASVARVLDGLQLLGLVAIALFGLSTPAGASLLGLAGDSAEHVVTVLRVCWIVALSVSVTGLVFAEIALHPMRDASHLESGRVRAAAISGATLALAASYGALFVYAASEEEAQADFSYFKTSEPGEATIKLLERASKPVQVTAFFPKVNQVRKEVEAYLNKLAAASGNLEVKVVDRYLEPGLAKELKAVSDGTIVLSMDDASKSVKVGTNLAKARKSLMKFDSEFYEELVKLITSRRTVYWTTGHGELNDQDRGDKNPDRSAKIAEELLQRQNLRVRELGLSQGLGKEVPDDADAVLILGPTQPFAPEEIATIERYAARGGKVLMALDTDGIAMREAVGLGGRTPGEAGISAGGAGNVGDETAGAAANDADVKDTEASETGANADDAKGINADVPQEYRWLTELAAAVGARFKPAVLADPAAHVVRRNDPSDRIIMPTNRFSSHASVSTLSRNSARAAVVVMGAGYLEAADGGKGKPSVTLRTLPSAFDDKNRDYQMNDGEKRSTFTLGVALTHEAEKAAPQAAVSDESDEGADEPAVDDETALDAKPPNDEPAAPKPPEEMRAFVLADADVLSDMLMERVVGNQMLLIDAVRWLVGEESLAGEIESEEDIRVEHTKQEDVVWFYSTIFGVPALVLLAGVWTSRRLRRGPVKKKAAHDTARGADT